MSGSHLSKEFFDLVKAIGESRSKQEEDKIIANEVVALKHKMAEKDVPPKRMKEYLIRMIYVEMLGVDASFGHIHAVKLASGRGQLVEKRVAYLSVCQCLTPEHSFMLLLVNTLQNDLRSDNYLEAAAALTVVCKLVNKETIPALLPLVVRLLDHKEGQVKKKAIIALQRFLAIDPTTLNNLQPQIRKALCDSNISVMGAALCLFQDLCSAKPLQYKDLVPDFVSILKQVIEHRLPRDYDYHRMPAPWIQLKLLSILAVLGAADRQASDGMYEILHEVMKRADVGINVGYAIVYECVRTVTTIYPNTTLIEAAAQSIARFLTADNHNLKYLGITALAAIVQIDSRYAAEHQMVVIDCLEDSDDTLRRKTLDLLYSMTNPHNVQVIVDKLLHHLRQPTTDTFLRTELAQRIVLLAEKYAPNNTWYIDIMNTVFELGGELIRPDTAATLMRLIAESAAGQSGEAGGDIRQYAVETYFKMLKSDKQLPDHLLRVVAWTLGEFGHLAASSSVQPTELLSALSHALTDRPVEHLATKSWLMTALMKAAAHCEGVVSPAVLLVAQRYQSSRSVDLQQRAYEFVELSKNLNTMRSALRSDALSSLSANIDTNLSFLDSYVSTAVANGAKPYQSRSSLNGNASPNSASNTSSLPALLGNKQTALNFTPYAAPSTVSNTTDAPWLPTVTTTAAAAASAASPTTSPAVEEPAGLRLMGVQRKWGPQGYNEPTHQPAASPAAVHTPPVSISHSPTPPVSVTSPAPSSAPASNNNADAPYVPKKDNRLQPQKKPLSEKEKLASSLFAGMSSSPTTAPPPSHSTVTSKPATASSHSRPTTATQQQSAPQQAPRSQQQQQQQPLDLLGLFDATPSPAVTSPAASVAATNPLDEMFGSAIPSTSTASTSTAAPAPGGDLISLFTSTSHGNGGVTSKSNPQQSSSVSAAAASSDPFAALLGSTPAAAPSSSSSSSSSSLFGDVLIKAAESSIGDQTVYGFGGAASSVKAKLLSISRRSSPSDIVVLSDTRVQISVLRAFADSSTVVAVFVANRTGSSLSNVTVTLNVSNGVGVDCSASNVPDQSSPIIRNQSPTTSQLLYGNLPPRSTTTILASLVVKDPVFASATNLAVTGSLESPSLSGPLSFTCPLAVDDFIRAAVMNTAEYGALWKQHGSEAKGIVRPTTCTASPDFMQRAVDFKFHSVQTIGMENIVAAKLVSPSPTPFFVLMHGKLVAQTPQIDLIVRSKSQPISAAIAKNASAIFK